MQLQGGVDANHLGVGLAVGDAGEAVEGVAADARTRRRRLAALLLIEQDPERQVERLDPLLAPAIAEVLDNGLVLDGRIGEGNAGVGLAGIFAAPAVDMEQLLGLEVVLVEGIVADRPTRRRPLGMVQHLEILASQPDQRRAVDLGIAADVIVQAGMEGLAALVVPGLVRLVLAVDEDGLGIPIVRLAFEKVAALQHEDAFARGGEAARQRSPAGAAADHDHIIMVGRHGRILR